jgi:lysozyme family protein
MSWDNFLKAFNTTMTFEGGYANDPDDAGGETYMGISRRYHPDWVWWAALDGAKEKSDFPQCLRKNKTLNSAVRHYYKQHYWDPCACDAVSELNTKVAHELFDTAVNMGTARANLFFQQALNFLNRNQIVFPDLVEDGIVGSMTLTAFRNLTCINTSLNTAALLKIMNILQGMHYLNYMKKSPTQEKYARGWLKRVSIDKHWGSNGM